MPTAVITVDPDGILALGAAVAREMYQEAPPIVVLDLVDYAQLKNGQWIVVDEDGLVIVKLCTGALLP